MKKIFILLPGISLLVIFIFFCSGCSVDEKCYICQGYQGTLWMTYENVCGNTMLNYYRNIGFTCTREKSKSVLNITGPEDEIDKSESSDDNSSDCMCGNQ